MTSSIGTKRSVSAIWSHLGNVFGTFTREEFAPSRGSRTTTARLERQIRHIGERVTRVDGERREHREDPVAEPLRQLGLVVVVEFVPRRQLDSLLAKGWHDLVDENSLLLGHQVGDDVATSASCSAGSRPSEAGVEMPAAC